MALCSHQVEHMGVEPTDGCRTGPTFSYSQQFTGVFCRFLSPCHWPLQARKPLLPKGASAHQGAQQTSLQSKYRLQLPPEHFGIFVFRNQQARRGVLILLAVIDRNTRRRQRSGTH